MLGCFGVAPPLGQAISTATSGAYGGNMDYRRFGPGTTAYFPVSAPGALFFLGDGHFCQGDGEIVGTGIETSFEVEFTVRVRKGARWAGRAAKRPTHIFTLGNARPLDQALQHATTRDDGLARAGLRARRAGREPSARPERALRCRQCLQPRLFRRLPGAEAFARRAAAVSVSARASIAAARRRPDEEAGCWRSRPSMCAASARRASPWSASRRRPG